MLFCSPHRCSPAAATAAADHCHTLDQDDDTYCRANNVAAGSPEYIACRKDRDAMRDRAAARADRRQRDLGDYMISHPDHP